MGMMRSRSLYALVDYEDHQCALLFPSIVNQNVAENAPSSVYNAGAS